MTNKAQTSSELQQQMARIRYELNEDVEHVVEQAKELADWRNFVRSHPWVSLGAAVAVGFMVVPQRLNVMSPDVDTLEKLAKRNKLVVKSRPDVQRQAGVVAPLVSFVGAALLRTAVTMIGQKAGAIWADGQPNLHRNAQQPPVEPLNHPSS